MEPFVNQNEKGYSLVEVLVSTAILGGAIFGLSSGIMAMNSAKKKMAVAYAIVALRSQLTDELGNEMRYLGVGADVNRVRDPLGTPPISFGILASTGGSTAVVRNTNYFFNERLESCGGFSPNCQIRLQFDIQSSGGIYKAAYRIAINPDIGIPIGNLGTASLSPNSSPYFAPADFRLSLPDILKKISSLQKCDGPDDIGMREFNRDTGEVKCLKKPAVGAACPAGTILKGYIASATDELIPDCAGAAIPRAWNCPPHYRLHSIPDPRVFDSEHPPTPAPTCIWVAQPSEVVGAGIVSPFISGLACPRPGGPDMPNAYAMTNTCTLVQGTPSSGICYPVPGCYGISTTPPPPPPPTLTGPAAGTGPGTDSISCFSTSGVSDMSGCADGSPGVWPANVSFPGGRTCNLTLPEYVPATGSP
jgi:hypothetical protein